MWVQIFAKLILSKHLLFVLVSVFTFHIFTFPSTTPEPLGQFQPNLTQSILGWRGLKFVQMKGPTFFQGEIITKKRKYIDKIKKSSSPNSRKPDYYIYRFVTLCMVSFIHNSALRDADSFSFTKQDCFRSLRSGIWRENDI